MEKQHKHKDIFYKTQRVLANFLKIKTDGIRVSSKLREDLGVDSVDFIDITTELEREFQLKIPNDPPYLTKVGDLVNFLAGELEKVNSIKK